ncbi:TetR/AcrR family transcriptional regulator [Verticiella sediminum]|nr:TetR/AcrR family transcriptional regulator [Verticiella sediminum]
MSEAGATTRRRRPDQRRDEILTAARRRLLAHGLDNARIDDIAADAGIAKGTFYLYFRDRQSLVAALREQFVEELAAALDAAVDARPAHDWTGRLAHWVEQAIRLQVARTAEHDLVFHDLRHADARHRLQDNPVVHGLARLLEQGARAGAWQAPAPELLAVLLFHATHGASDSLRMQAEHTRDHDHVCATVVQWALNSLAVGG